MNRVTISERREEHRESPFVRHHPVLTYLFGDMVRGTYLIGCLALDVFFPAQLHQSFPDLDSILLPSATALVIALVYSEFRLYRRLWPASSQTIVRIVEEKDE